MRLRPGDLDPVSHMNRLSEGYHSDTIESMPVYKISWTQPRAKLPENERPHFPGGRIRSCKCYDADAVNRHIDRLRAEGMEDVYAVRVR